MHFVYTAVDKSNLCQGDVLKKTDELSALIETVHPHYQRSEYTHFQVITQSCDLVRRGSRRECNTRYITLAAVRSFRTVLLRLVEQYAPEGYLFTGDGVICSDKYKDKIIREVESLLNNNNSRHFYLEACPENGFLDSACTFLPLSIAIKAQDHYEKCLDAKILQLQEVFQSKLGWLVGNLYSRVGTPDMVPHAVESPKKLTELVKEKIEGEVIWASKDLYPHIKTTAKAINEIQEIITAAKVKKQQDNDKKINDIIGRIGKYAALTPEQKENLTQGVQKDTLLSSLFTMRPS